MRVRSSYFTYLCFILLCIFCSSLTVKARENIHKQNDSLFLYAKNNEGNKGQDSSLGNDKDEKDDKSSDEDEKDDVSSDEDEKDWDDDENWDTVEVEEIVLDDDDTESKIRLGSNKIGEENFDVSRGIPTNKPLYCDVRGKEYRVILSYGRERGANKHFVTVSKTYNLTWYPDGPKGKPASSIETVSKVEVVISNYVYYYIQNLGVYVPKKSKVYSDVFEGGEVEIYASDDVDIDVEAVIHDKHVLSAAPKHISIAAPPSDIVGGRTKPSIPNESFAGLAEAAVAPPSVRNDRLVFNGIMLSSDAKFMSRAPSPAPIPDAALTREGFFYKEDNIIPESLSNGIKSSNGEIFYSSIIDINVPKYIKREINSSNTVLVHSPVVAFPHIESRTDIVQKDRINEALAQLIIGDSFKLSFPFAGSHRDILGYGTRSYEDSIRSREVKFPFDVFRGSDKTGEYFPKNTWIKLKAEEEVYFIPEWVHEKDRDTVLFRSLANNYSADMTSQKNHNLDYANYKAVDLIDVALVGKVFDFRIDATTDPAHKTHFSTGKGYFKAGDKDEFGKEEKHANYLPLNGYKLDDKNYYGSHLKLAYKFHFSFKTTGDMLGKDDVVVITPRYKLKKEGAGCIDVDLYYKVGKFIKPIAYKMKNMSTLNLQARGISDEEFKNTSLAYKLLKPDLSLDSEKLCDLLKVKKPYNIQYRDKIVLGSRQKTFIGDYPSLSHISSLKEGEVLASVQKWYGDFYLPASTLVVPKGTDLGRRFSMDTRRAPFIQKGLIVVGFQIDVYHDIDDLKDLRRAKPYISYMSKNWGNQWKREGFRTRQIWEDTTIDYDYGDVAVYDISEKAYNNYR